MHAVSVIPQAATAAPPSLPSVPRSALSRAVRPLVALALTGLLAGCGEKTPELPWQSVDLADARLTVDFPCAPDVARRSVDLGQGPVAMAMVGCDAEGATYALSHWLADDERQAEEGLVLWQAAVLGRLTPVDQGSRKSGEPFVPQGALNLPGSIRATVEGVGPSGWTITTHAVWFARQEGEKVRVYHAVIYAPKAQHAVAEHFFGSLDWR